MAPKKKAPARKRKPAPARVSEDEDEEDVWEDASLFAKTEAAPSDAALARSVLYAVSSLVNPGRAMIDAALLLLKPLPVSGLPIASQRAKVKKY